MTDVDGGTEEVLVGVDVGGTFTDAVVVARGRMSTAKVPTTPYDQGIAVVAAVRAALDTATLAPGSVTHLAHGMTVGTNALLEGTGATIALVATEGFADVVDVRRQNRADMYRLDVHHPPPLVPRDRRIEVPERCGPEGVIQPLDPAAIEQVVERVRSTGVESVAVGLLFSYAHPEHERAIAAALRSAGFHVSASSEVLPEIREYERVATTCVDAHLAPVMRRYLDALDGRVAEAGLPRPLIMQSNGGVIDADVAAGHPAWTVLSGPAGGVIGAAHVARLAGEPRVLSFDMGGTSCDVALIDGQPAMAPGTVVNGHPVHLPLLDIHTVSAGGGSVAWADAGGALRVGPRSAGALPGPAAYGRGGREPTVTDANVVLGRIDVATPLGRDLRLDDQAAHTAVAGLADQLAIGLEACAAGILAVAVEEIARALRVVSVQRGVDPRELALVGFGGAGPLHACDVADALGMTRVILPPAAGLLAALGLVVAGERHDAVQSVLIRLDAPAGLREACEAVSARIRPRCPDGTLSIGADCRYVGQTHTLTIPWNPQAPLTDLAAEMHRAHRDRYGDAHEARAVEVVSIRASVARPGASPVFATAEHRIPAAGPASFALDGATGWLAPGWRSRRGPAGTIVLER